MEFPALPTIAPISRARTPETRGPCCLTAASTWARKEAKFQHGGQHLDQPLLVLSTVLMLSAGQENVKLGLQDTEKCLGLLERMVTADRALSTPLRRIDNLR